MKRVWIAFVVLALAGTTVGFAQGENLSEGRKFGFGVQWTGEMFGLSLRYWFNTATAAELDVFFLPGWVANISVRGLLKPQFAGWAFDTLQNDFYVGAGIGLLDISEEDSSFYLQGFAGIEANSSHTAAWNLEFGVDYLAEFIAAEVEQITAVTFGLGIHLYP